jgi:hypothetical protein
VFGEELIGALLDFLFVFDSEVFEKVADGLGDASHVPVHQLERGSIGLILCLLHRNN